MKLSPYPGRRRPSNCHQEPRPIGDRYANMPRWLILDRVFKPIWNATGPMNELVFRAITDPTLFGSPGGEAR